MVLIREIAVLCGWKRQMSEEGGLSVPELAKQAHSIQRRLDARIAQSIAERDKSSDGSER
jgi:hypothetical protein